MERRGSFLPAVLAFTVAFNLGILIGRLADDGDERVKKVQAQNEQIYQQLDDKYQAIGGLVLDDEDHTFKFNVDDKDCTGEYKLDDDLATAVGNISCTTTVALNGDK